VWFVGSMSLLKILHAASDLALIFNNHRARVTQKFWSVSLVCMNSFRLNFRNFVLSFVQTGMKSSQTVWILLLQLEWSQFKFRTNWYEELADSMDPSAIGVKPVYVSYKLVWRARRQHGSFFCNWSEASLSFVRTGMKSSQTAWILLQLEWSQFKFRTN
jgi:hypothetical protein